MVINRVRDISNNGNIHGNESVDVVSITSEINNVTEELRKSSHRKSKPNINIDDNISLPSNTSDGSTCSNNNRMMKGIVKVKIAMDNLFM